ncbi:MAG: hypothetical protein IPN34_17055 [Planctomycetes bacterium]|nr:hypothetical protein [Planctomycetota bacterium]
MKRRPRRSAAYLKGTEPAAIVAQRYGLPVSTLYAWTRTQREMSGEPVRRRRRRAGAQRASPTPAPRPSYPPEERSAAV